MVKTNLNGYKVQYAQRIEKQNKEL